MTTPLDENTKLLLEALLKHPSYQERFRDIQTHFRTWQSMLQSRVADSYGYGYSGDYNDSSYYKHECAMFEQTFGMLFDLFGFKLEDDYHTYPLYNYQQGISHYQITGFRYGK